MCCRCGLFSYKIILFLLSLVCFIRQVVPLVCFLVFFVFPQKRPSPFLFIGLIKKALFGMMEFHPKSELVLGS